MRNYIVLFVLTLCFCSCDNRSRAVRPWEASKPVEEKTDLDVRANTSTHVDTLTTTRAIRTVTTTPVTTPAVRTSLGSTSTDTEVKYTNDGHPGTKPDDGLFGFDPYDDEDDAYDVERNQVDPYPDEW